MDPRPKTLQFNTGKPIAPAGGGTSLSPTATTTRPATLPFSSGKRIPAPTSLEKEKSLGLKLGQRLGEGVSGFMNELTSQPDLLTVPRAILRPVGAAGRAVGDIAGAAIEALPGNIEEKIGQVIAPVVSPLMEKAAPAYGKFKENNPEFAQDVEDVGGALNIFGAGLLKKPVTTAIKTVVPEPDESAIKASIAADFQKGIKPASMGNTVGQIAKKEEQITEGVRLINENRDGLSFRGKENEIVTGVLPKTRRQLAEAVDQTKKTIFTKYNTLAQKAGETGFTVKPLPIITELEKITNDPRIKLSNPEAGRYAEEILKLYRGVDDLKPDDVQDIIKNINERLHVFYERPSYSEASRAAIDALVVNNLRKMLDEGVEKLTGGQYQDLKRQYGALKSIEKDVIKAANREGRENAKGLIDYTDILTGGDLAMGLLTLNAGATARGLFGRGIKEVYKYLNDPNRSIESMFRSAEKLPGRIFENRRATPLQLPAPGGSSYRQTLFATPEGRLTPNQQEASDVSSVELGKAKTPELSEYYIQKVREIEDRLEPYFTPEEMKIIQMGPKPKAKETGLPTAPDVPPAVYSSLFERLERYLTPEEMEIIDWGPKPKKRLFNGPVIDIDQ